ncbi:MAG: DUF1801 domain-containing protein [Bacteroidetes bacterium]|nr:DUF1801 domain-containing protein [Bacteroidota bacterium]
MPDDIFAYHKTLPEPEGAVADRLFALFNQELPEAEAKLWHGHPVWFLDGNPVAGYSLLKKGLRVLFWSGQSFNEPGLKPEGKFKAAEADFPSADLIPEEDLRRWLRKSRDIQWDYKNIVRRKGELIRLN